LIFRHFISFSLLSPRLIFIVDCLFHFSFFFIYAISIFSSFSFSYFIFSSP
jgi:hypothetical protein